MNDVEVLNDIVSALKSELDEGYSTIRGLVSSQGKLIAKQTAHIAKSRVSGSLKDDDELFQFLLEGLEKNAVNLARAVVMLSALTIEKAWNAIAGTLWSAIRATLSGAGVPNSLLPDTPPFRM